MEALTELGIGWGGGAEQQSGGPAAELDVAELRGLSDAGLLRALNPLETRRLGAAEVERGQGGRKTFGGEESRRRNVLPAARRNHDSGDAGF